MSIEVLSFVGITFLFAIWLIIKDLKISEELKYSCEDHGYHVIVNFRCAHCNFVPKDDKTKDGIVPYE